MNKYTNDQLAIASLKLGTASYQLAIGSRQLATATASRPRGSQEGGAPEPLRWDRQVLV